MINRIVVLPDIHCPNHDEKSIEPILQFIKFYKPHMLIQLGDFCDWDSVTTYDPRKDSDIVNIETEVQASNAMLDRLDEVTRKAEKIMLGGNHEARYEKFFASHGFELSIRRMRDFSSWHKEYNLEKRGWKWLDYGKSYALGKCIFTHGWFSSGNAAKKMAECFPGHNVIFGHTHQHLIYGCMDHDGLPIESESIGTLSRFDLSYLVGKPPINWIHSFMYIDMEESGRFTKHYVRVIDGHFIEYGKVF